MELQRALISPAKITGRIFCIFVVVSVCKGIYFDDYPRVLPLLTALLSAVALLFLYSRREGVNHFSRTGFHIGFFAFFLYYPLFFPKDSIPPVPDSVVHTVDLALFLTLVGFELAYGLARSRSRAARTSGESPPMMGAKRRRLLILLYLGIVAWFITILDIANAFGVTVSTVLLTMRGPIETSVFQPTTALGYISIVLGAGIYLSATAACLLLAEAKNLSKFQERICWLTLVSVTCVGFLRGSRAVFLYSTVPLLVSIWIYLSRWRSAKALRWVWASLAMAALVYAWSAMSVMRGGDIRDYEGGWENFAPSHHMRGALDIYTEMAMIVQAFPDTISYEHGKSLLPLVFGWIPRTIWQSKPYPFSNFANFLKGETLERRAASLAVGLTGEGYGNFGLFGAFLWGFLFGLACRRWDRVVAGLNQHLSMSFQLSVMSLIWAAMITRGGVPEMFYMGLQVILLPFLLGKFLLRGKQKTSKTPQGFKPATAIPARSLNLSIGKN